MEDLKKVVFEGIAYIIVIAIFLTIALNMLKTVPEKIGKDVTEGLTKQAEMIKINQEERNRKEKQLRIEQERKRQSLIEERERQKKLAEKEQQIESWIASELERQNSEKRKIIRTKEYEFENNYKNECKKSFVECTDIKRRAKESFMQQHGIFEDWIAMKNGQL